MNIQLQSTTTLGKNINVIAITGGPCSGKTTGLAKLVEMLQSKGYKVLVSPESATKLILGGIHPWELHSAVFQRQILLDTLLQEERFFEAARAYRDQGRKVVILCDRGAMDGQAYVSKEEFGTMIAGLELTLHDICDRRYHAVIHLRTAALGKEEFYTLDNNEARKESPEEARELDQKTLEAWQRHHHPRVVDNSTGFDEKIERLLIEVCSVLGDPEPIEIEQKFLIEPLDLAKIPVHFTVSEITQDYLFSDNSEERRVRARSDEDGTSYFYTIKRKIRLGVRFETERIIDRREYEELLALKNPKFQTIKKRRVCFFHEYQFIEVDLFNAPLEHTGLALMEIEQTNLQRELILPSFVNIVREVTSDSRYSNLSLAGVSS